MPSRTIDTDMAEMTYEPGAVDHVVHCVEHAIKSGDKADQRRKIAELMEILGRVDR